MAEEKRPLESEPQAAPEASTPDVPGAPAPDLSGDISQPVHDGPAQPDPGDVVISFEKIDELLKERRDAAREKVEQESLENCRKLIEQYHRSNYGRITCGLCPLGLDRVSADTLRVMGELSEKQGLLMHSFSR